jgi:hypothetical protein
MASSFLSFLDHTQWHTTVGGTPLDKWSARRRDLYLTTHNTRNRQTSIPPVRFEPTISAGERPQTYALRLCGYWDWLQTYTYHMNICKSPVYRVQHFLGLVIDNNLSWHYHTDQMIPKLNKTSYVIRSLKPLFSFESLKMVYFSTVHSIISYGIILWCTSSHSKIIFKIQKRIVRIITNSDNKDSCWDLLKKDIFSLFNPNAYFLYSCLLSRIKTFSKQTRMSIGSRTKNPTPRLMGKQLYS